MHKAAGKQRDGFSLHLCSGYDKGLMAAVWILNGAYFTSFFPLSQLWYYDLSVKGGGLYAQGSGKTAGWVQPASVQRV